MSLGSVIGKGINFASQVLQGPLGGIAIGTIGNLLNPTPTPPAAAAAVYNSPKVNTIQEYGSSSFMWGGGSSSKPNTPSTGTTTTTSELPTWVKPLAWGVGILALLGILWKLFTKKGRK